MRNVYSLVLVLVLSIMTTACSKVIEETASKELSKFDVNMYSLNKLVCDPFDGGPSNPTDPNYGRGLKANLYYLRDDQPRYQHVADYINSGMRADQFLFFTQLNVPTRMFNIGFPTESGSLVKRDDGQVLQEYFALRLSSVIHLGPDDEPGDYELAILSDDGAIMRLRGSDGQYQTVVDNDGDHPTKMGCGSTITMTRETQKLMQFDYYQGPRYHISVIPMWRKKVAGQAAEPRCGQSGNNLFFNENTSAPQAAYNDLLSRGWKPLDMDNYSLPVSTIFNPCEPGVAPVISNFTMEDNFDGVVIARWTTDIPATSQLRYVDMTTGTEELTDADNELRTEHEVVVMALKPGRQYLFQGVSISDSYGKTLSAPITLLLR
ncbi:MAG: hypothetical protein V4596_08560 [Bdellovibrionota bacterium]